mgnify:CR=1 FL=1
MKRFLKRFFLFLLLSVIGLLILSFAVAALFEQQIGDRVIRSLNQRLKTELTVGSMDMTVLESFPALSADLKNIQLPGTDGQVLLEAETLSFRFSLLSILRARYRVKSIKLSNGAIAIHLDKNGQPNYLVFDTDTTRQDIPDGDGPGVNLEQALLSNVDLLYSDEQTQQFLNMRIDEARFSGNLSSRHFDLQSNAQLVSRFYEANQTRYLVGTPLTYDAIIQVDLDEKLYQIEHLEATVDGNTFQISGVSEDSEKGVYYDLLVSSQQGSVAGVLQLLPEAYGRSLGEFSSTGSFSFEATVKGLMSEQEQPAVQAVLDLKNGQLSHPAMQGDFKKVSFRASFQNGDRGSRDSSVLKVDEFTGYFNRQLTEMQLTLSNLDDPEIDFTLNGSLPVGAVYGLLGSPSISDGSGELDIENLRINGKYQDMVRTARIGRVQAMGRLTFDDAALTINGERMIFDRGTLDLNGNQLKAEGIKLEGADSDLELSGNAFNLLPVLFADSTNSQRAFLEFQANLTSQKMDIGKLLTTLSLKVAEQDTLQTQSAQIDSVREATITKQQKLTTLLKGKFQTRIENYTYDQIQGSQFVGQLDFFTNQIAIKGRTEIMSGTIDVDGRLYFLRQPSLEAKLTGRGLNIRQLFAQTNNFGQQVLTSENLSGQLGTQTMVYAFWDNQGNFQPEQLRVLSAIGIEAGNLRNFELMERFSTFVNIKDLQNIQFTRLENFLEISNNRIYLPAMFIQSNALNLTVSGEHDFRNQFEYNLQVNAGQVLINRFKSHDPALRPVAAKKKGFFNLYYRVYGNLEDYAFESAKRQVQDDFSRSQYRKREIQRTLEGLFGTLDVIQSVSEMEENNLPEETEYMDFDVETDTVRDTTGGPQ